MKLYRYDDTRGSENTSHVHLSEFEVIRQTEHCYVIRLYDDKDKFVLMGEGKRYAYPTIEQARASFKRRKQMQLGYLAAEHDRIKLLYAAILDGSAYTQRFSMYNSLDFV